MSEPRKPILCLDFDGVIHSYTSKWEAAHIIPDPPVPGALEALQKYSEYFEINIFSSRSHQHGGIQAMEEWLIKHFNKLGGPMIPKWHESWVAVNIKFPKHKPPAMITIDDRGWNFDGTWPDLEELKAFQPWNKK